METHEVESVCEYIGLVEEIAGRWFASDPYPDLWYRGIKAASYDLLPGAYFRKQCDEQSITLYFRSMSPSLLHHEPTDDWEWYYAMQHYGVPTRLLDWTESPLAALYFAIEEEWHEDPAVWILDPTALNRAAGCDSVLCPYVGKDLDYWLPDLCGRHAKPHKFKRGSRFPDNSKPLAIYPKRFNPRIVAQRGVFTVHGMDETPINQQAIKDSSGTTERLAKVVFPRSEHVVLRKQLHLLGLHKSTMYPEPQSIAEDLKRSLGIL